MRYRPGAGRIKQRGVRCSMRLRDDAVVLRRPPRRGLQGWMRMPAKCREQEYVCVCMHVCMYACICIYRYICVHISYTTSCLCLCIYIYTVYSRADIHLHIHVAYLHVLYIYCCIHGNGRQVLRLTYNGSRASGSENTVVYPYCDDHRVRESLMPLATFIKSSSKRLL